jgi:hypothetical protein
MIIESLVKEYLVMPDRLKISSGTNSELTRTDFIANEARYQYITMLRFYIKDLINEEKNVETLKFLIENYTNLLLGDQDLIICLFKKYLFLDPTNEQYYKKLAELIILHWHKDTWASAQIMYKFAQEHNWRSAAEILNSSKLLTWK